MAAGISRDEISALKSHLPADGRTAWGLWSFTKCRQSPPQHRSFQDLPGQQRAAADNRSSGGGWRRAAAGSSGHPLIPACNGKRKISTSLQEHLLGHIAFLKERGILKGGVPAGFSTLLMLHDEMKSQQGNLNTAGDLNNPTSVSSTDEQSSNLLKRDQTVDERYNHMLKRERNRIQNQDDTSLCEDDSRDGKFGEKKRASGKSHFEMKERGNNAHESIKTNELILLNTIYFRMINACKLASVITLETADVANLLLVFCNWITIGYEIVKYENKPRF
ncbi:unnamed protein product [Ranitomeya imitator]|uniref:Uncharacterized protein n=1 Tax=Ranitomeya imitator TaxID=111125 RepID=A0ABN9LSR8_9NEOB|nr:unnamed protein product [Ranitomeya imitator]